MAKKKGPKTRAAKKKRAAKARASRSRALTGPAAIKAIDGYVARLNPPMKQIATELRRVVRDAVPESREAVNPWGIPVFDSHGPFALIMASKHHISFGFPRATSLADAAKILEGTGKNMRHVKITTLDGARDVNLHELIVEAAALNRLTPLTPTMRIKK
jgi:hypothetical protein